MSSHRVTANLEQTYAKNFQPIIWYIWFSSFFLQAQVVRRLAAKVSIYFKVVVNAFHSLFLSYMQVLCQCGGFQTVSLQRDGSFVLWLCIPRVTGSRRGMQWREGSGLGTGVEKCSHHKKDRGRKAGSTDKRKRTLGLPGVAELGHNCLQELQDKTQSSSWSSKIQHLCLCSSGKLYFLFSEFTFLLAGVFSDSCSCAVLELPLTQPPLPTHISLAVLLQQVPNNVFLRSHSPRSRFPKLRTVAQLIIKQFSRTWSLEWRRKWQMKRKGFGCGCNFQYENK